MVLTELIKGLEDRNHVNVPNLIDNVRTLEGQMEEIAKERKSELKEAHPSLDFMIKIIKIVYVLFASQSKHEFTMRPRPERQIQTSHSSNSPPRLVNFCDDARSQKICRNESFGPGGENSPSKFESKTSDVPKKDLPLIQRSQTTFPRLFNVFTGQFPHNRTNPIGGPGVHKKDSRKKKGPLFSNNTIRVSGGNKNRVIVNHVKRKMPSLIEIGDLSP